MLGWYCLISVKGHHTPLRLAGRLASSMDSATGSAVAPVNATTKVKERFASGGASANACQKSLSRVTFNLFEFRE